MHGSKFKKLDAREQALVSIAVLLDGKEGAAYLENDAARGIALSEAAAELAALDPELRMPFVGTLLRAALQELRQRGERV